LTGNAEARPVVPENNALFRGLENLPPALWEDLDAQKPDQVCRRAGVIYRPESGYIVPFLGVDHLVQPESRSITVPEGARRPGFQVGLVMIKYLVHAGEEGLSGRMVTARELDGGALFFQGPHALSTAPVLEKFGRRAQGLATKAQALGATSLAGGDAAFRLLALPKVLLAYTLYEADEEFPARLTITFDAHTDRHLPLDAIWALVNVISHRLAE